jgi:hypothetical protein
MIEPDGDVWLRTLSSPLRTRTRSVFAAPLTMRRYWYVFHTVLARPATRPDTVFACRELTLKDHHLVDAFPTRRWREHFAVWLDEPDTSLFVAFHGGLAVAYECVSHGAPDEPPFRDLDLSADEAWLRDAYAIPGYRGRGAIRALRAYRSAVLSQLGFCGSVSAVAEDRHASLAATYDRLTWKVEGLDYRRVLLFRRTAIERDARARLEEQLRVAGRRRAEAAVMDEVPAAA